MKKLLQVVVVATLPIALVAMTGSGVAWAKHGSHARSHAMVIATGSTTCHFHGRLGINLESTVSIVGTMTPSHGLTCSSQGGTKLRTGHMSGTPAVSTGTVTSLCSLVTGGTLPDVSGGAIMWSPKPKVAGSTGVALTGGAVSVVTVGSDTFLQITYSGGSVAGGSFTNTSGGGLNVTSVDDVAGLAAACAGGPLASIAFNGSITL